MRRQGVAWVNMREHRSLKSKPAKRLHAWLCAWASPVERKSIGLDKLLVNVWGGPPAHADARKDRVRTLRQAIKEVGELRGWSCDLSADGKQLLVRKPRFAGTLAQAEQDAQSVSGAHTAATPTAPAGTTPQSLPRPPMSLPRPPPIGRNRRPVRSWRVWSSRSKNHQESSRLSMVWGEAPSHLCSGASPGGYTPCDFGCVVRAKE